MHSKIIDLNREELIAELLARNITTSDKRSTNRLRQKLSAITNTETTKEIKRQSIVPKKLDEFDKNIKPIHYSNIKLKQVGYNMIFKVNIDQTKTIVLKDSQCRKTFFSAIDKYNCQPTQKLEKVILNNLNLKKQTPKEKILIGIRQRLKDLK
jgi:hypothetical protein